MISLISLVVPEIYSAVFSGINLLQYQEFNGINFGPPRILYNSPFAIHLWEYSIDGDVVRSCDRIQILADDLLRCVPITPIGSAPDIAEYNTEVFRTSIEFPFWNYAYTVNSGFYYASGL